MLCIGLLFNFQILLHDSQLTIQNPLQAQDIHFTQIDVNPILFNPAYSGFFDGKGRFGLIYRNQWASVSKAFQTTAATAEIALMRRRYSNDGLSLGLILFSDRAGTLNYGSTAGNIVVSYFKALDKSNDNFISLAAEVGLGQAGFNASEILLGDPTDNFNRQSANYFTIGAGAAWFYQPDDSFYLKLGLCGRNLNRPDISYLEGDSTFIERKYSFYTRCEYRAWSNVSVLPLFAMSLQKKYSEAIVGCDVKWYLAESSSRQISFSWGLIYRWRDAALVQMTAEYNALLLSLAYDANISKLTPASKSIGAFEVAVVYRLTQNKHVKRSAMPCPII